MTIIQSFCCWKNVRTGSFASGTYTMMFYTFLLTGGAFHIHATADLQGPFGITLLLLVCSAACVISSVLLLVGLCVDSKSLLLPWIVSVTLTTFLDIIFSIYIICEAEFDLRYAILFLIDFVVCLLNLYCLLCVISQYQEYAAGRGRAGEDYGRREIPVQYVVHQPQTCDQPQKADGNNSFNGTSNGYFLIAPSPSSTCDSRSHPSTEMSVVSEDQSSTATGNQDQQLNSAMETLENEKMAQKKRTYSPTHNEEEAATSDEDKRARFPLVVNTESDSNTSYKETDILMNSGMG